MKHERPGRFRSRRPYIIRRGSNSIVQGMGMGLGCFIIVLLVVLIGSVGLIALLFMGAMM